MSVESYLETQNAYPGIFLNQTVPFSRRFLVLNCKNICILHTTCTLCMTLVSCWLKYLDRAGSLCTHILLSFIPTWTLLLLSYVLVPDTKSCSISLSGTWSLIHSSSKPQFQERKDKEGRDKYACYAFKLFSVLSLY